MGRYCKWVFFLTGFDQAIKLFVKGLSRGIGSSYNTGLPYELFRFTYIKHHGSALESLPESQGFFLAITAVVLAGCYVGLSYYSRSFLHYPLLLVMSGALSNGIDRLVHGGVIDYLDLGYNMQRLPTINLADVALVGGGIWLIGASLFAYLQESYQRWQSSSGSF